MGGMPPHMGGDQFGGGPHGHYPQGGPHQGGHPQMHGGG